MAFPKPKLNVGGEALVFQSLEPRIVSLTEMFTWQIPTFQRNERQTKKVMEAAKQIKETGGVVPGVFHLGILEGDDELIIYLVDGQQRRNACHLSGLESVYIYALLKSFPSFKAMKDEYVQINDKLVPAKADDLLKAEEIDHPELEKLRKACPFVGYGNFWRDRAPILSMSVVLKSWFGSALPRPLVAGQKASLLVPRFDKTQRELVQVFLTLADHAWQRGKETKVLWGSLNVTMCMYLYRILCLNGRLPKEMFGKCLMSVSADQRYRDWILGRHLCESERLPTYQNLKKIFDLRLMHEYHGKPPVKLPKAPDEWKS